MASQHSSCQPFTLPSHGVISINPTSTLTLTSNVLFTPECHTAAPTSAFSAADGISSITDVKDPFYASTTPQAYATGAATVIAWMLVFMLLITPRTFFVGGADGGFGLLGRRGMISGARGGSSVIGVGSRPWLQKVAALTVAISMTIATADTFKVAEAQYSTGVMNAEKLRAQVVGSNEIKVSRIVSDIFIWLALVQTLIRLFPRHKEKVLIKWVGFALIILDATFSCLNSFLENNPVGRPEGFRDAVPALSYLFQLALSMLYAAWVIYYSIVKRRFAFYHSYMWNISMVALLSFVAILTPVIFFITDISNASVAGWGDYFRWVGAAAASVIVWEWVERIEALEREEKKDGILGREIFDGDEMLDVTPSEGTSWPRNRRRRFWSGFHRRRGDNDDNNGAGGAFASGADDKELEATTSNARTFLATPDQSGRRHSLNRGGSQRLQTVHETEPTTAGAGLAYLPVATPPPVAVSPVSRADTGSAASTVYTIRYHTVNTPTAPVVRTDQRGRTPLPPPVASERNEEPAEEPPNSEDLIKTHEYIEDDVDDDERGPRWKNPFKRRKALPPAEVRRGQVIKPVDISNNRPPPVHNYSKWDLKGRLGAFAAEHGEKFLEKRRGLENEVELPVTIIPAQPRGRTWSPDVLSAQTSDRPDTAESSTGARRQPSPLSQAGPSQSSSPSAASDAPWPINPASPPPPGVRQDSNFQRPWQQSG
jgi:PalH/RIM21